LGLGGGPFSSAFHATADEPEEDELLPDDDCEEDELLPDDDCSLR
jgi:hypothetical protein